MATAKFNSIRAGEVLVLGVLGFGKNGLHLGVREIPTTGNVSVVYGDLFFEVQQMIQCRSQAVGAAGYRANA